MTTSTAAKLTAGLLTSLALALAGIVTLAGAGPQKSRASVIPQSAKVAASPGAEIRPPDARAETDMLDLQLD